MKMTDGYSSSRGDTAVCPYLYAPRVWGLSPATDQQSGGLLMWVPVSLYMIVIMSLLFLCWMQQQEQQPWEEESRWDALSETSRDLPLPTTNLRS